jgi:hypothetical protein
MNSKQELASTAFTFAVSIHNCIRDVVAGAHWLFSLV